jgi:hypothetical protein
MQHCVIQNNKKVPNVKEWQTLTYRAWFQNFYRLDEVLHYIIFRLPFFQYFNALLLKNIPSPHLSYLSTDTFP